MPKLPTWTVLVMVVCCGVAYAQVPQALQLMKGTVIPESNVVFAVGNKAPASDAEWAALQKSADSLVNAARQLQSMAPAGGRAEWAKSSDAMGAAAGKAAAAAKTRNVDGAQDAGDALYETCEGCHRRFMKK